MELEGLGNQNFSIHLSRSSFDRKASTKVISRATQYLTLEDANVNERNGVRVKEFKMRRIMRGMLRMRSGFGLNV